MPNEPPTTDNVVEFPAHTGLAVAFILVGTVDKEFTVIVREAQDVVLHVPSALI